MTEGSRSPNMQTSKDMNGARVLPPRRNTAGAVFPRPTLTICFVLWFSTTALRPVMYHYACVVAGRNILWGMKNSPPNSLTDTADAWIVFFTRTLLYTRA